ncbi:MAG: hypothetical protein AAGI63_17255 [Planctomycetota bacterium]
MRITLYLLLFSSPLFSVHAQVDDPFGPGDDNAVEADWIPSHPGGDTPHSRMMVLAHTDALPKFDRIELYAVSMKKSDASEEEPTKRKATDKTFPVRPYGAQADIHAHVTLSGDDCEKFRKAWQSLNFDPLGGAFCHYPAYGFRLYRDDALLFESTVCWKCQNFYIPEYDAKKRRYT